MYKLLFLLVQWSSVTRRKYLPTLLVDCLAHSLTRCLCPQKDRNTQHNIYSAKKRIKGTSETMEVYNYEKNYSGTAQSVLIKEVSSFLIRGSTVLCIHFHKQLIANG